MQKNKAKRKAVHQIQKNLRQPGHKKEKKAFNNARRGYRIKGTSTIESATVKARKRTALKRETRKEIDDAD